MNSVETDVTERERGTEQTEAETFLIGDDLLQSDRKSANVYLPSLEEIAAHCERFQASWSKAERDKRLRGWQPD